MAVHDAARDRRERIGPDEGIPYLVLCRRVRVLTEEQLPDLRAMLRTVTAAPPLGTADAPTLPAAAPTTGPSAAETPPPVPVSGSSSVANTHPAEPRRGRRIPKAEANVLVRDWLARQGAEDPRTVTVRAVNKGTGVSVGQISNLPSWRAFEEARSNKRNGAGPRTVPLSNRILLNKPEHGAGDPAEIAAQNEEDEVWTEIVQRAESSTERARLTNLSGLKRTELIEAYLRQKRDTEDDCREPPRRERSRRS
jgi:hypothetical protein